MNAQTHDLDAGLAKTLAERRSGVRDRLIIAFACAVAFAPLAGLAWIAAWLVTYGGLQEAERRWFAEPANRGVALGLLTLDSLVFGLLALTAIVRGGAWGAAAGGVLLTAALFNGANTRQRSWAAFVATAAPLAGYLVIMAGFAWRAGGGPAAGLAVGAATGVAVLAATRTWKGLAESLAAQRRARSEADRRRLEAESAAGAASVFAATAGHELRTPLTAILAAAEALERAPKADPAVRRQAALIGESGQAMRVLLDDLLDLAKIDAGRMRVERIDFDLAELVADTAAIWAAQAERRGLTLTLEGAEALPRSVAGDPLRLRQVLGNLISNAIKFTDQGGVAIRAVAAPLTEAEQRGDEPADWLVRLTVADTGPGLTPGQLERLFTPFDQAHDSTARTHGGTGLGLSISRDLARLMGGDLFAHSPAGGGAVFTFEAALFEARGAAAAPARDLRVLVVDDHEMGRRALGLMLEPYGVQLAQAATAEAALEMLATQPFDVVLMDLSMPHMGGREACRRLRATAGPNQATPVIACTASSGAQDWDDCRAAGMTGLVAKPIDAAALHAAIAAAMKVGGTRKVAAA